MKKIKLDKIEELIYNGIKKYHKEQSSLECVKEENYNVSDYNEDVSNKFNNLVTNLLNYDTIKFEVYSDRIGINVGDVKGIKKISNTSTSSSSYVEENFLEIEIKKDFFSIRRNYSYTSRFKDDNLFKQFHPLFVKKINQLNNDNFDNFYNEFMKESGLLRDSNLDELLKQNG